MDMNEGIATDNRTFFAPWLILPEKHQEIMDKVSQPVPGMDDPSALLAHAGKHDEEWNFNLRGDVAIVKVTGGLTLHANYWSFYYRWSVYENLSLGIQRLLDNPRIRTIILVFDSPGGTVFGLEELVDMIYQAREKKRLLAFVQGYCTSAAYWIASACETVVVSKGSYSGSIGSKIQIVDFSGMDRKMGIITYSYVSKQAPYKTISPGTAKGDQLLQEMVDNTGERFVRGVARNRGVSEEVVLEKFGKGWMLSSDKAVSVGMADYEASLEDVIQTLGGLKGNDPLVLNSTNEVDMFNDEQIAQIKQIFEESADSLLKGMKETLDALQASQEELQQNLEALGEKVDKMPAERNETDESSSTTDEASTAPDGEGAENSEAENEDYKAKYEAAAKKLEEQEAEIERLKELPNDSDYQKEHGANSSDDSPGY